MKISAMRNTALVAGMIAFALIVLFAAAAVAAAEGIAVFTDVTAYDVIAGAVDIVVRINRRNLSLNIIEICGSLLK